MMRWYRVIACTGVRNSRITYAIDVEALSGFEALEVVEELWHDYEDNNRTLKHPQVKMLQNDEPILYYDFTVIEQHATKNGFQSRCAI